MHRYGASCAGSVFERRIHESIAIILIADVATYNPGEGLVCEVFFAGSRERAHEQGSTLFCNEFGNVISLIRYFLAK